MPLLLLPHAALVGVQSACLLLGSPPSRVSMSAARTSEQTALSPEPGGSAAPRREVSTEGGPGPRRTRSRSCRADACMPLDVKQAYRRGLE